MPPRNQTLIKQLLLRTEKLEKEMREVKKWAGKEKKKINIIAWLNEHYLPSKDFSDWVKDITVGQSELELIFRNQLEKGLYYILEKNLPIEDRRHFPIIAFKHQHCATLYIYDGQESWQKLENKEFNETISYIHRKILKAFATWTASCSNIFENYAAYDKKLKTTMLLPERKQGIYIRLRRRLCKYLSLNLKNIVEYEFIF